MAAKADKPQPPSKNETAEVFSVWAIAGEIGIKLTAPLLLFMLPGIALDKALGTLPAFMITGMLIAFATSVAMIYGIIRRVEAIQKRNKT